MPIHRDLKYETAISKLMENGYAEKSYGEIRAESEELGVATLVLWQNRERGIRRQYRKFEKLLKNTPTDVLVMDLKTGKWKIMTLKSVLEAEKQEQEPESPDIYCRCCDG